MRLATIGPAAAISFGVSAAVTGIALLYARRRRLLDVPNDRSSHSAPTPRIGGLGIVIGALAAAAFDKETLGEYATLAVPLGIAATGGFLDDVRGMRPLVKLVWLLLAAWFAMHHAVIVVHGMPYVGDLRLHDLAGIWLTLVSLALYPNAFNFMDGIDGIASLTAVVSGAVLAVAGASSGDAVLATWAAITTGAALGFLPWNFPRARTFMGDVGSLPLGLLLAWCAVRANASGAIPFPASILLLGPFLFDVAFTLFRRWREGKTIGEAHKEHLYQRLSRVWDSHAKVSLLYAGFSVVTGVLALSYVSMSDLGRLLSLVLPLAAMLGFAAFVLRAEREKGR